MTSLDSVLDKDGVRLTVEDAVATVTLTNPAKRNAQISRSVAGVGRGRAVAAGQRAGRRAARRGQVLLRRPRPAGVHARGLRRRAVLHRPRARLRRRELDATIAEYQEAFTWWRRNDIVSDRRRAGACRSVRASSSPSPATCGSSRDDVQFAMRETSLGLVPDLTGTHPLVRLVGYARALEICATGPLRPRGGGRAHRPRQPRRARRRARRRGPGPGRGAAGRAAGRGDRDQGAAARRAGPFVRGAARRGAGGAGPPAARPRGRRRLSSGDRLAAAVPAPGHAGPTRSVSPIHRR